MSTDQCSVLIPGGWDGDEGVGAVISQSIGVLSSHGVVCLQSEEADQEKGFRVLLECWTGFPSWTDLPMWGVLLCAPRMCPTYGFPANPAPCCVLNVVPDLATVRMRLAIRLKAHACALLELSVIHYKSTQWLIWWRVNEWNL